MDGVVLYVRFRGDSKAPWAGSFVGSCSNWLNVFIPLQLAGCEEKVTLISKCVVDGMDFPEYMFSLLANGDRDDGLCVSFGDRDLLGDIVSIGES
jgi:hypothetical protein